MVIFKAEIHIPHINQTGRAFKLPNPTTNLAIHVFKHIQKEEGDLKQMIISNKLFLGVFLCIVTYFFLS